jgi:hypothetical protein
MPTNVDAITAWRVSSVTALLRDPMKLIERRAPNYRTVYWPPNPQATFSTERSFFLPSPHVIRHNLAAKAG